MKIKWSVVDEKHEKSRSFEADFEDGNSSFLIDKFESAVKEFELLKQPIKSLDEFKHDVLDRFNSSHMFHYCPHCYGAAAILNSHRCNDAWIMYYKAEGLTYDKKVEACVKSICNRPTIEGV